jgi:hypothetical protein
MEEMSAHASLSKKKHGDKLTEEELACALYEGMPHLQNLAEKLARQHGKAGALSFYGLMGSGVQAFWRSIARQMIEHSKHWQQNDGSCCVLDPQETDRLKQLAKEITP